MKKVEALIVPCKLDAVCELLVACGCEGLLVSEVHSHGHEASRTGAYRGTAYTVDLLPKLKVEVVVCDEDAMPMAYSIIHAGRTEPVEDPEVTIVPVDDAVRIRTGEHGRAAIHSRFQTWPASRRATNGRSAGTTAMDVATRSRSEAIVAR